LQPAIIFQPCWHPVTTLLTTITSTSI
jgi:hypothetical protein